ncbi:IucA/IucC family protein [uncultured Limnobacter sp.]|uniref:IucA/IucC family protein n=1 Tax=uncultured Limnobacter sp. TaxID=199681 RepID=UPI0030F5E450
MNTLHNQRIALRLINACLREDVRNLLSLGRIESNEGRTFLVFDHLPTACRIEVKESPSMQTHRATNPHWEIRQNGQWVEQQGARQWIRFLAQGLPEDSAALYRNYELEVQAAIDQTVLCDQTYTEQQHQLNFNDSPRNWAERMLHADQMASFLDHPYYPTARAKFGMDTSELKAYSPEFNPTFELAWFAVPASEFESTGTEPVWWPTLAQVGLPQSLCTTHTLLPVHPMMRAAIAQGIPESIEAPHTYLSVKPTLSVRTVAVLNHPASHLKLPMPIATLGQKNIRYIKPSTLRDGDWFARALASIEQTNEGIKGLYRHVDESFTGCYKQLNTAGFLHRLYPAELPDETLATVATLCSPMPSGKSYLLEYLEQQGQDLQSWWASYCTLMIGVHLRLWIQHGIALESNQQNSVLSLRPGRPPTLVMKDNDAARLWPSRFETAAASHGHNVHDLQDARILVNDEAPLAHMFITITLQLNLLAVLDGLAQSGALNRQQALLTLRKAIEHTLGNLRKEGFDTDLASELLLYSRMHPVKYLLQSASLLSKQECGARDVNKFYGMTGPNPLRDLP